MSFAYYNEFDTGAAEWLRELMKAGLIASGDVDERSIEDVAPTELAGYTQCHFFAGIGVWSYALRLAGWPDDQPVWTGSCPCQPFSAAGKGEGIADERHLWPAFFHLIRQCRPGTIFGEQVASRDGLGWLDIVSSDLEAQDYAIAAVDLCIAGFGAPHIRQRLFFVAHTQSSERRPKHRGVSIPHGWDGLGRSGVVGQLDDTVAFGCGPGWDRNRSDVGFVDASASEIGELAQSDSSKRRPELARGNVVDRSKAQWNKGNGKPGASGDALQLEDADGGDTSAGRLQPRGQYGLQPGSGGVDELGDSRGSGLSQRERDGRVQQEEMGLSARQSPLGRSHARPIEWPGPTNGFWVDPDWLLCRDGLWRPVEAGTFPLAHGTPARMGRLRGYGNAISPWAAKAFIEATGRG